MPLIAYRQMPKNIVKNVAKIIDATMQTQKFSNKDDATKALDSLLAQNKIVGLQTSVFYLPYFPKDMRFHFNAHNLIVFDKIDGHYHISDPVFEESVVCSEAELNIARFAKGIFAPKGFLYYVQDIKSKTITTQMIQKAIRKNAKSMLTPFPLAGIKGMKRLAKDIAKLQNKDARYQKNFLTHIVRMQEEIGTGGGGFRYLYAAFLDEAKEFDLDKTKLEKAQKLLIDSGNALREFALLCVQASKDLKNLDTQNIAQKLQQASEYEKEAFALLKKI